MPDTSRPLPSQIETLLDEARELLEHSSFITELTRQGGRLFLLACKDTQLSKEAHTLCQEQHATWLQEVAWEKLHTGNWKDVCQVWRDAYTLACLLVAAGNMRIVRQSGNTDYAAFKAAVTGSLRELDLAVIMGGPLFRPQADAFIAFLQQTWEAKIEQSPSQPPAEEPQQKRRKVEAIEIAPEERRVHLPPGSLEVPEKLVVREAAPSLERFWTQYMSPAEGPAPVVITGAIEHWPARQRWHDLAYLKKVAGARTVPVEIGSHYLAEGWGQQLMPLADFIDRYVLGNREEIGDMPKAEQAGRRRAEVPLDKGAEQQPGLREGNQGGLISRQSGSLQREEGDGADVAGCFEGVDCCIETWRIPQEGGRNGGCQASQADGGKQSACRGDEHEECAVRREEKSGEKVDCIWPAAKELKAQEIGSKGATADRGISETTEKSDVAPGRGGSSIGSPVNVRNSHSGRGSEQPGGAPNRGYLAQHPLFAQIPALKRDIEEPLYCCLGDGKVQSVNAWFGPPGTVTPLHHDPHHNLLAQVVGRKYIRLYTPASTASLAPYAHGQNTNSSQVDLEAPDHVQYPDFLGLDFVECVLSPGEMLYIPVGWWHFVKSLDVSFSVTFWWR